MLRKLATRVGMAKKRPTVAIVRLQGVIQAGHGPGAQRLVNLQRFEEPLVRAFQRKPDAVGLVLNSPGGSPVQSSLIYKRIQQLKAKHELPVISFVEDVCASGGYYIAAAADEIYADESSIVGSIGVVRASFGFQDAIRKIGVERRVQTAGRNKSQLDPFLPEKEEDVARVLILQQQLHQNFIDCIKEGRGARLKPEVAAAKEAAVLGGAFRTAEGDASAGERSGGDFDAAGLFDGSFYAGRDALEIGLIDGLGDLHSVAVERFGAAVELVECKPKQSFGLPPFLGGSISAAASTFADSIVESALQQAEERVSKQQYELR